MFVASFGTGDDPGSVEEDWLGAPMFFSSFEVDQTLSLLQKAGLHIVDREVANNQEHGEPVSFLWVICSRGDTSVSLVNHRAEWSEVYDEHKRVLTRVYGAGSVAIEHIGSTAIRGIAAKPIVDIAVGLRSFTPEALKVSQMEDAGCAYFGERGVPGRQLFAARWPHTVHVHVVRHSGDRWTGYVGFRNVLLRHPARACPCIRGTEARTRPPLRARSSCVHRRKDAIH